VSNRFPRQYRLLTPHDYKAVFDAACRVSGQHITMQAKPNQLGYSRLGLIVSKKQLPTAVARNTIKRVLRESFRIQPHQLMGLDVVVIAYKSLGVLSKPELHACVSKQWEKLRTRFGTP
jgi:ribonuclease P protein component